MEKSKPVTISLLAAFTKNQRVIGINGKIPWSLKSERDRFKKICNGKYVIMGRKSFNEIGHALPYCTILIVSKSIKTAPEKCLLFKSLNKAIKFAAVNDSSAAPEVLIAGGQEIYQQSIKKASKIYATEIEKDFEGDRFFPEIDKNWKRIVEEEKSENGINYCYVLYQRLN